MSNECCFPSLGPRMVYSTPCCFHFDSWLGAKQTLARVSFLAASIKVHSDWWIIKKTQSMFQALSLVLPVLKLSKSDLKMLSLAELRPKPRKLWHRFRLEAIPVWFEKLLEVYLFEKMLYRTSSNLKSTMLSLLNVWIDTFWEDFEANFRYLRSKIESWSQSPTLSVGIKVIWVLPPPRSIEQIFDSLVFWNVSWNKTPLLVLTSSIRGRNLSLTESVVESEPRVDSFEFSIENLRIVALGLEGIAVEKLTNLKMRTLALFKKYSWNLKPNAFTYTRQYFVGDLIWNQAKTSRGLQRQIGKAMLLLRDHVQSLIKQRFDTQAGLKVKNSI